MRPVQGEFVANHYKNVVVVCKAIAGSGPALGNFFENGRNNDQGRIIDVNLKIAWYFR